MVCAGGSRERQIDAARHAWAQGFVAEAIDRFCRSQDVMDTSGTPHRGVLTGADMAAWQPPVRGRCAALGDPQMPAWRKTDADGAAPPLPAKRE